MELSKETSIAHTLQEFTPKINDSLGIFCEVPSVITHEFNSSASSSSHGKKRSLE